VIEVHARPHRTSGAAAALRSHDGGNRWVVEVGRRSPKLHVAPDDGHATLELVERDPHAGVLQSAKFLFETVLADASYEVVVLAARLAKQREIRAPRIPEDAPPDEVQEALVARPEPLCYPCPGLFE
jgi:hypothetical protein